MKATINGKEVGFSYGLYFLGKAQEATDKDLFHIVQHLGQNALSFLPDLMYLSMEVDAQLDGNELQLSKREFIEWLEKEKDLANDDGLGAKFIKGLTSTIKDNLPKDDVKEDGNVKKK